MAAQAAHASIGRESGTHRYVIADVPDDVSVERHDAASLPPAWDAESTAAARRFGDPWLNRNETRSAILLVPSVVARLEWNALVNPAHPGASQITLMRVERVVWDRRLFSGGRGEVGRSARAAIGCNGLGGQLPTRCCHSSPRSSTGR